MLILSHAVRKGRIVQGNTIKYIKMSASSNFGNVLSVVVASIWLPGFQPMSPLLILTNNLLYDLSQTMIPFDRMDEDYLEKPKPWNIKDLFKFMICIGPMSSIFDMITFALGLYYFGWNDANNLDGVAHFQTTWFVESLLTQSMIVHLLRTHKMPFVESRATPPLFFATFCVAALGIGLPYTTFGVKILGMLPLPNIDYAFLAVILFSYFWLVFAAKNLYIRIFKSWL